MSIKRINLDEYLESSWVEIYCSHSDHEYSVSLEKEPKTFFVCCDGCHSRLLGSFIKEATKIVVRIK